jgi:beta-galactosidase
MKKKLEIEGGHEPSVGILAGFGGSGPRGESMGLTKDFAVLDGKPWIGVIGEFHYTRYPRRGWKEELAKMGCGGVDIVSTYVFWIHHEEVEGAFDWSGDRDLRGFILACGEAGLRAIVRIGPFAHGEVRNGGFPDWLYGRPFPLRSNDARYLERVRKLYAEIGRQLDGLFFKDGGPVIGIQLENEFMHAGAPWEVVPRLSTETVTAGSGGLEHMRILKRLAAEAGMIAPFYTSTGWGGAPILEKEILPLYGGYAFRPWNIGASTPVHSPTSEYIFRSFRGGTVRDEIFDPPYEIGRASCRERV